MKERILRILRGVFARVFMRGVARFPVSGVEYVNPSRVQGVGGDSQAEANGTMNPEIHAVNQIFSQSEREESYLQIQDVPEGGRVLRHREEYRLGDEGVEVSNQSSLVHLCSGGLAAPHSLAGRCSEGGMFDVAESLFRSTRSGRLLCKRCARVFPTSNGDLILSPAELRREIRSVNTWRDGFPERTFAIGER